MEGAEMADELLLVVAKLVSLYLLCVELTTFEGTVDRHLVLVKDFLVLLLYRVLIICIIIPYFHPVYEPVISM